jgi:hypothetical protein
MKPPTSPMMARLDAALAASRHPVDTACVRAERAGLLARQGNLDEANAELQILRRDFTDRPAAVVTVWICIVEAWIEQYSGRRLAGRDKMRRAQALSAAARLKPLQALSAAWLAHFGYLQDDFDDMAKYLTLGLQLATPDHHAARGRAALVAASGYHRANRLDLAQPWYIRARAHAVADTDDSLLSTVTFMMACHRSNHASRASIFGSVDTAEARRAQAWLDASFNFDQWVGSAPQDSFLFTLRAQLYSAQRQHAQALALYETHLADADRQGLAHMRAVHIADQAWCRFHTGDASGARTDAQAAAALVDPGMSVEDLAIACGRLDQVFEALGDIDAALRHRQLAREHWATHQTMMQSMIDLMGRALAAEVP